MQWISLGAILFSGLIFYRSLGESGKLRLDVKLKPRVTLNTKVKLVKKFRALETLMEVPDFAALLWFAVCAGESLENSLRIAVSRSTGFVSSQFSQVIKNVDLGALLQFELQNLGVECKSDQVRELATKLAVALDHGTALADLIADFVQSASAELRTSLLDKAAKNETKMMIPLVFVILPVTVMFSVYPSLALIQTSFL